MPSPEKNKRSGDFKEYLVAELKKDPEFAAEYLNAAISDGDTRVFLMALGDLTKAKGMSAISKKTGLNRENIYRIVSENGNPQIKSVLALLDAVGVRLKTEPSRGPRVARKRQSEREPSF
jgi:probable addiction module antidote protein